MSKPSPSRGAGSGSTPIVFEWLERIGLGYAVPYFKEKGIISPKALTSLTIKDYEDLHVSDLSDRKRLYELVQRVRLASRSVKQRSSEEKEPASSSPSTDKTVEKRGGGGGGSGGSGGRGGGSSGSSGGGESSSGSSGARRSHQQSKSNATNATTASDDDPSAREVLRKQRAKDRIRRMTQSPAKKKLNQDKTMLTPVSNTRNARRQGSTEYRSDTKDDDEADLASASPLVPIVQRQSGSGGGSGGGGSAGGGSGNSGSSLGDSRAGNAYDILGLGRESFEDAKIRVVVRKRPLSRKEKAREDVDIVDMNEDSHVYLHEPRVKVDMTRYVETHEFAFDHAFDEKQNNLKIYEVTCRPLLCSVFDRNAKATCFAYGQTGSGKTHTMMGPENLSGRDAIEGQLPEKGLYEMAAEDIFRLVNSKRYQHIGVFVSFFEIYGGRLFDLLNERRKLRNMEDANKQVQIVGLRSEKINNINDLFQLMSTGHAARSTGSTGANVDSSRSHAILQIKLIDTRNNRPTGGKFSFIDLAGSERGADTTHNNRQTRMEGAEINKSLLALKECIRALFHVSAYQPFRGSKLTQVLKDSFVGGNSHTVMVVTISPNLTNAEHTLNTLRYGYRVKEIKNDAR